VGSVNDYQIEMLWTCSVCRHAANLGLTDRYCGNCGHKKDTSDVERMPDDMSEAAALSGEAKLKAEAGADWVCKYCQSNQNQRNKCCGNCGGDRDGTRLVSPAQAEVIGREVREDFEAAVRETEERGRQLDEYSELRARASYQPTWSGDTVPAGARRAAYRAAWAVLIVALLGWLLLWLFTPRVVDAKVSQVYWQHDTLIERYAVHKHEGWYPTAGAFEVWPVGLRHHHYDRVHVGSHQESYQDRYACGETCSTSSSTRSCRSNSNGTATCTTTPGTRTCSTKYCTRTAYRTVQDYRNVSREQVWFAWKAWGWAYNRTVSRSGFTSETTWPTETEWRTWLTAGEQERSTKRASYKVTLSDVKDGESYVIRPETYYAFTHYELGSRRKLKVNNAGSVEVLP
jgi:hypothetical protein